MKGSFIDDGDDIDATTCRNDSECSAVSLAARAPLILLLLPLLLVS